MDWETAIWRVIPCCRDTSLIPPTSYTTPRNLARGNTLQQKLPAHRSSKKGHHFHVVFLENVHTINANEDLTYTFFLPAGLPSLNGCAVPSDSAATGTAPMVEEAI